ncbi:MAG: hypothetical protein IPF47_12565 [Gemmatimonadetes bacterium]|nr:hypothetical protein [Gemmatimonadota bacterium]MBK7832652.1 hypothetical protein [Gemmatimonadota bacterium]
MVTNGDGDQVIGAIEVAATDWPGANGGLITNGDYQLNIAYSMLRNAKSDRVAAVRLRPQKGSTPTTSTSKEYLSAIVAGVHRFLTDF